MSDFFKTTSWNRTDSNNVENLIEKFVNVLNIKSIKDFNKACKEKHLEIKNQYKIEGDTSKLNRTNFMSIMRNIYNNKSTNQNDIDFDPVFDLLFKRFKLVKYDIKSESIKFDLLHKNVDKDVYFVNDIIPEEREIDVFEIAIALSIYIKCDFKEKIRLLFDITDVDEDGYINENEIRYMITTVNFIFSDEESLIGSDSSIVNQSLASIKSQQIFNMIMKYPGDLSRIITTEKYVHFDQFYNSITKIIDYKYSIIPIFVDMKTSLFRNKAEPEYELEKRNVNEFLSIANEIVSNVKIGNNEYVKHNQDMKKIIDQCKNEREKKIFKKKINNQKINFNSNNQNLNNINNINGYNTNEIFNNENSSGQQWGSANKESSNPNVTNFANNINKKEGKASSSNRKNISELDDISTLKKGFSSILNKNFNFTGLEGNRVNLNRISNLEAQPGKIRIKENTKEYQNLKTDNTNSQETQTKFDINVMAAAIVKKYKGNMSLAEIMNEIRTIANKHNSDNDQDSEEILKKYREIREMATALKSRLHSNTKTSFSLFDYKPRKNDY